MIIHQNGDYYTAAKMLMDVFTCDAAYTSSGDQPSCSSRTFESVRISWDSCECELPLPRRPSSTPLRRRCDVDYGIPSYDYHDHHVRHHIRHHSTTVSATTNSIQPCRRHFLPQNPPKSPQVPGDPPMLCIQPPTLIYYPIIRSGVYNLNPRHAVVSSRQQ